MKNSKHNFFKNASLVVLSLIVGYGANSLFSISEDTNCKANVLEGETEQSSDFAKSQEPEPEPGITEPTSEVAALNPSQKTADGHYYLGNDNAPITVTEYTDYQCTYCQRYFFQTYGKIKDLYVKTGLVKYIVKNIPLSFHPAAPLAATASFCAGEQGKYWEMHSKLFAYQGEWSYADDLNRTLLGYARELKIDDDIFSKCLTSGKFDALMTKDQDEATSLGISGTPSFSINDQILIGAQPLKAFEKIFNSVK